MYMCTTSLTGLRWPICKKLWRMHGMNFSRIVEKPPTLPSPSPSDLHLWLAVALPRRSRGLLVWAGQKIATGEPTCEPSHQTSSFRRLQSMRLLLYEVSFRLYSCTNDYVDNLLIGSRIEIYAHACARIPRSRASTLLRWRRPGRVKLSPTHKVRRSSAIYNRQCTIKTIPRLIVSRPPIGDQRDGWTEVLKCFLSNKWLNFRTDHCA